MCDRWHVSASSTVIGGRWRYLIINVSAVSFCRWLVIEIPRWMLKTKLSLPSAFADARCVTGCIFRHAVLLGSLLFWELQAVLTSLHFYSGAGSSRYFCLWKYSSWMLHLFMSPKQGPLLGLSMQKWKALRQLSPAGGCPPKKSPIQTDFLEMQAQPCAYCRLVPCPFGQFFLEIIVNLCRGEPLRWYAYVSRLWVGEGI